MTDQERFTARAEKIVGMWINGELATPHDAVRAMIAAFAQVRREALEEAGRAVTIDPYAGAGYVYLTTIRDGDAVRQVQVDEQDIVLDFNANGELIGIEFLSLAVMPQTIRERAREGA